MLDHIDLLDRPPSDDTSAPSATPALPISIACVPCGPGSSGGGLFHRDLGVAICADNVKDHETFTDELTHSLINAWDHRRFAVDWRNLRHIACAHIRAASLSGECKQAREIARGHLAFNRHHQACVKRRATLAVLGSAAQPSREDAERAVSEVFESCFADTRPFDEIY